MSWTRYGRTREDEIFRGTNQEIADGIARIEGDVREAIVLIEEPVAPLPIPATAEEMFAEMEPFMVKGPPAD